MNRLFWFSTTPGAQLVLSTPGADASRLATVALLLMLCGVTLQSGTAAIFRPTPFDSDHVVPLAPADFRDQNAAPAKIVADRAGTFDQSAVAMQGAIHTEFRIRHAGKYALWVRVSRPLNRPVPIRVRLTRDGSKILEGLVNDDEGNADRSGPAGRTAYLAQAKKNTPAGATPSLDANKFAIAPEKKKPSPAADDLTGELLGELREKPSDPWVSLTRVEEFPDDVLFYWWKLGTVELKPGEHQLHIEPTGKPSTVAAAVPRFDAAFLTTNTKIVYPYGGDIGHSRATYVRFRLDKLPKEGVRIAGAFQTHVLQFPRLAAVFGAAGIDKESPHTNTGFTPWYRLQDIDKMPEAGSREIGMQISMTLGKSATVPATGYAGATQFAVFPHADFVVREFDWSEPTGLAYTVPLDCETYAHRLMNFRDHAREHYQMALAAADRLNPLTRGELNFIGFCGSWNEDDRDYAMKTMRLMGFNSMVGYGDPLPARKQYGWNGAEFVYPPLGYPFDEAQSQKEYEDYFRRMFADPKTVERWKDATSFCMADEPGEMFRAEMTAPVWQFHDDATQPYWRDVIGGSELVSRPEGIGDCVAEGVVEHEGSGVQFRVGIDDPQRPSHYWYWFIDYPIGAALNSNFAFAEYRQGEQLRPTYRMVQSLGSTQGKLRFKIVHQGTTATLFINGKTIHQHLNLPKQARFAIAGGKKKVYELRLRPMLPGEGVSFGEGKLAEDEKKPVESGLEELGLGNAPSWAKRKPVRQAVEEDWLEAGGDPAIQQAFRNWAKSQGLSPEVLGAKDWEHVRPLTMPSLVRSETEARLFYWSRRFSGWFTPHRFEMMSDAARKFAPNPNMWNYPALSGGVIYRAKEMPLDMFALSAHGNHLTGGISDWMFYSTWRWDGHQAVAYSVELYNAGARRHGQRPLAFPMMHCVAPTIYRAYTEVANQVKLLSCYSYGPYYLNMPDAWSQNPWCYTAVSQIANRAALCDDILSPGVRRPSRLALLYAHSTEYWNPKSSADDKRSTFLGLSHEYFQPEVVTEQQVLDGALKHYDALYVLEPNVAADVQQRIGKWTQEGGLLWACADALTRDEYNAQADLLQQIGKVERQFPAEQTEKPGNISRGPIVRAEPEGPKFRPHAVVTNGLAQQIACPEARILARYENGGVAWLEKNVGKGKLVYVGHRAGSTYTSRNVLASGYKEVWPDTGRALLTQPLHAAGIERPLVLSEPTVMATATDTEAGSVIILYNLHPNPRQGLVVKLREEQPPQSVETFEGLQLKSIPFEHRDGWISAKLDEFDEGQIVVVRRQPKPADERLVAMRERTLAQLTSPDLDNLSAGIWFAGFFPEWDFAEKVAACLDHSSWRIRRAAAEAVGRLGHAPARELLWNVAQKETDAHALADQLAALVALGHPGAPELCLQRTSHPHFIVRSQAMHLLAGLVSEEDSAPKTSPVSGESLVAAVQTALADGDQRVRQEAIATLGRLNPDEVLAQTMAVFRSENVWSKLDRPLWAAALGRCEPACGKYLESKEFKGDNLAIAVAQTRRDPKLAEVLVDMAAKLPKESARDWAAAMLKQQSPETARKLFEKRAELPEHVRHYLCLILEHAFEAGLGEEVSDWEAFFRT